MIRELFPPDRTVESILLKAKRNGERWRPSVFLYPFQHGDARCLYHTLTKRCLLLDRELFERLLEQKSYSSAELASFPELSALAEMHFLVPEEMDESKVYYELVSLLRLRSLRKRLSSYTILTTTACNARCFYCVEEGTPIVNMDEETLRLTVDFILRTREPSKPINLTWFGGEPLAASHVIDRISEALTEAGVDFTARMVTNGVLIDEKILKKMTGPWKLRYVQLSIDGEEQEYNRRKNYYRPYPSAYRVMEDVLCRLVESGIQVVLRCNVDEENEDGLERMVDDLAQTLPNKEHVYLYFSVLFSRKASQNHARLFCRCMEAESYAREKGFLYGRLARLHKLRVLYCGAENPSGCTVVYPDGRLFNCYCYLPEMQTGDVWNGLDRREYIKSFLRPDQVREQCRDCCFLPLCTSFSRCPNKHAVQCREVKAIELSYYLCGELDSLGRGGENDQITEMDTELLC